MFGQVQKKRRNITSSICKCIGIVQQQVLLRRKETLAWDGDIIPSKRTGTFLFFSHERLQNAWYAASVLSHQVKISQTRTVASVLQNKNKCLFQMYGNNALLVWHFMRCWQTNIPHLLKQALNWGLNELCQLLVGAFYWSMWTVDISVQLGTEICSWQFANRNV